MMNLEKNSVEQKIVQPIDSQHFTAEMVHELRNPLAAIKGFLQLIKPYLIEIGKEQYAEIALTELNRANELIYNFLKTSKPQANFVQNMPLNKVISDIVLLYESEAILKNIKFFTRMSQQVVILMIPADPLKQVLINLINNGIEAIEENRSTDRTIEISTHIDSTTASITITDSGTGITDEKMKNLFTPYYTSKEKGTGLGLCICKKIIEDHNGSLTVKSIPGKCTTFTVVLPIKTSLTD